MEPRSPALISRFFTTEPPVVPYQGSPLRLKVSSPITSVFLPALLPGCTEVLTIPYTTLVFQIPGLGICCAFLPSLLHSFIPWSGSPVREVQSFTGAHRKGFPCGSDGKESACQCRRPGFDPWVGKIPREGIGYPLQYSCLKDSMDWGAWWATVHGVEKSRTLTQRKGEHLNVDLENNQGRLLGGSDG